MSSPRARRRRRAAAVALAAAGLAMALLAVEAEDRERPAAPPVAILRLTPTPARVPPRFVGFSIEYWTLGRLLGLGAARPDPLLAPALRQASGGAPALRIGGNSADQSWPAGMPGRPRTARYVITPAFLTLLGRLVRASGATVSLTTNLAAHRSDAAAALLARTAAALPPGRLRAVAAGNEPDLIGRRHVATADHRRVRLWPRRYGLDDLLAQQPGALVALRATGVPFRWIGPGFATAAWRARASAYVAGSPGLAEYASHFYPLTACGDGRARLTPADLLQRGSSAAAVDRLLGPELAAARRAGLPLVVQEGNSVACAGAPGVSDHPYSALWAASILFQVLRRGARSFAFHSSGSSYDPFAARAAGGRWQIRLAPEDAGILLFQRAAPAGSRVLAVGGLPDGVRAWATRDRHGTLRLLAVNDDRARPARLALPAPRGRRAAVLALTTRGGVRLGGRPTGGWRDDAHLALPRLGRSLRSRHGRLRLDLQPAAAAVLTVPPARRLSAAGP